MGCMTESATVRRINELCRPNRAALHVPTNRRHQIVQEISGVGVELKDLLEKETFVRWDDWTNPEVWRLV